MTMGVRDDFGVDDMTVVDDLYSPESVYCSFEIWAEEPAPPREPEWMKDTAATAAVSFAATLRPGRVIYDGSPLDQDIEEFRHLLPSALGRRGLLLQRVPGGWKVCGTI